MGYAQDAITELHGDRIIDNTPPTVQAAYSAGQPGPHALILQQVANELNGAIKTHAPMNSHHEGYAVILEELDELWEVCKRNTHSPDRKTDADSYNRAQKRAAMRKEAIQVAAMAIRFIEDVCDK